MKMKYKCTCNCFIRLCTRLKCIVFYVMTSQSRVKLIASFTMSMLLLLHSIAPHPTSQDSLIKTCNLSAPPLPSTDKIPMQWQCRRKELWRKCFTIFIQGHTSIDMGFYVQDWWQTKGILCAHFVGKSFFLQRV